MFRNIAYSEILRPSELGIILSYQCNAECKHCLYACGPEWTEWIASEQLKEALEDGYVGKCHLCVDVRKHLSARGEFDELQPAQFYDLIDAQV